MIVDAGVEILCEECRMSGWCEHIMRYIREQEDAAVMRPDMHVFIPLFPSWSLCTVVAISEEKYPGVALMEIEHTPDFGTSKRIALGFWNEGEGRLSIRRVILDWLKSQFPQGKDDLQCLSSTHLFRQMKELRAMAEDKNNIWPNAWAIKMEGACIPCIQLSANPDDVPDPDNTPPWRT